MHEILAFVNSKFLLISNFLIAWRRAFVSFRNHFKTKTDAVFSLKYGVDIKSQAKGF